MARLVRNVMSGNALSSKEILSSFASDHPENLAVNLRNTIEALGTTYIKFGQMLSTRYDLLPKQITDQLAMLQDNSPKMPFETVEQILNAAYGNYLDVFESFDPEPIGAASIAQAHSAVTKSGGHVVVKIQRPNLLPLIRSDIDILMLFAKALDNNIEEIAYFNLPALIEEFERSMISELDFTNERANIEYFERMYGGRPMFEFPTPNGELTRPNILVMHKISGVKITAQPSGTPEARRMADEILDIAFDMVFRDGIFHADPHPGNLLATPDGRVGIIDFGLVGAFTQRQRQQFMRLVIGIQTGDYSLIARTLLVLGHITRRVVIEDLEGEIARILGRYLKSSLKELDFAAAASEFVGAGQKFAIQIPSEFSSAVRAFINIEGIIQYLNPDLNLFETLSSFSKKLLADNLSQYNVANLLFQDGFALSDSLRMAPSHLLQTVQDLNHDGIAVRVNDASANILADSINSLCSRLCVTAILVALALALAIARPQSMLFYAAVTAMAVWCVVLGFIHVRLKNRRKKIRIRPIIEKIKRRQRWF